MTGRVLGWQSSQMPTDHVGMAKVSRRTPWRSTLSAADEEVHLKRGNV